MNFFYSIHEDYEMSEFDLKSISRALYGVSTERIYIHTGDSSNGKSCKAKLIGNCFGDYFYTTPRGTFLKTTNNNSDAASPSLKKMMGCRFIISNEVPGDKFLDEALLKQLSGGDILTARDLNGKLESFSVQGYVALLCNLIPRFVDDSNGMKKRLTVIPHNLTFDPDRSEQENYRECDDNLKVNFENINYICAFLKILTEYFIKYFSKTKLLRDIPLKVTQYTKAYAEENDLVATWLKENYTLMQKTDPEYKNSKIKKIDPCILEKNIANLASKNIIFEGFVADRVLVNFL
jgi:putative DNA primase/helicase